MSKGLSPERPFYYCKNDKSSSPGKAIATKRTSITSKSFENLVAHLENQRKRVVTRASICPFEFVSVTAMRISLS